MRAAKTVLFSMLLTAQALFAFEKNPVIAAMPDTSWLKLNDYNSGRANCQQTLDYSGMVYDFHRHKILLFGGGHATALWNQTEEFDLATLTWKELNVPDSCPFYLDSTRAYKGDTIHLPGGRDSLLPDGGTIGYDGDRRPISRHTYDQLDMLPDTCLMIMSATQCDKGGCMSQQQWNDWSYFHDRYIWLFDPVAVKWKRLSPDAIPTNFACGTALDPATGLLYVAGGRSYEIQSYNWRSRERKVVGNCPVGWASCQAMTYNPIQGSMLLFTSSDVLEYNIAANDWTAKNPSGNHVDSYTKAVSYDTVNQVFGIFKDGVFSYYSPAANAWYALPYDTIRFPKNPAWNCTVYDPVNNAYISLTYLGYYGWTTWAYKLSDTPGRFPGTRGNARSEDRIASQRASIQMAPVPNPFKATVCIRLSGTAADPDLENGQVRIYDVAGKMIWKTNLASQQREVVWNAGSSGSGLYMAVYKTATGRQTTKALFLAQ